MTTGKIPAMPRRAILATVAGLPAAAAAARVFVSRAMAADTIGTSSTLLASLPPASLSELDGVWARAVSLTAQLDRGLAYNGQSRSYVIRRNALRLPDPVKQLVEYGTTIADRLGTISAAASDAQARHDEFVDSADKARSSGQRLSDLRKSVQAEWNTANAALQALDLNVRSHEAALDQAQADFKQAVLNSTAPQCGFAEIIKCVKLAVAVYTGGVALVAAGADAVSQLETGGLQFENLKVVAKTLEPTGAKLDDISKSYDAVKPFLGSDGTGGLIVIEKENLQRHVDATLKAIDDVSGAGPGDKLAFKDAVTDFVSAVQVKNEQILKMDGMAVRVMQLSAAITDLHNHETRLRDASQLAFKADLADLARSLNAVYYSYLRQVRDFVWESERAVDYSSLQAYAPTDGLNSNDIASVAAVAGALVTTLQSRLNAAPGYPERFPQQGDDPFSIRVTLSPVQQKALLTGGLVLRLLPSHRPPSYGNAYWVFGERIKVRLSNIDHFQAVLTHMGASRFEKSPNDEIEFTVASRPMRITENWADLGSSPTLPPGAANSDAEYLGLSPFSDWLLQIRNPDTIPGIEALEFVELEFQGTLRTLR